MKIVIITTIILIFFQISKSQIVINEISSSNFRNYFDEDNEDSDWIELYNTSDQPINLKDWKLFDKNEIENAFVLPDTIIQAKGRLIIFASGKNRYTSNKLYVETTGMGIANFLRDEIFHFKYIEMNEDFFAELIVNKIETNKNYSGAGLIFKEKLDSKSKFASIISNNYREAYCAYYKNKENVNPFSNQMSINFKNSPRIKLEKVNDTINLYAISDDNYQWIKIASHKIDFDKGYLGLCFAASDSYNNDIDKFIVSDFKVNGKNITYESLQSIDISSVNLNTVSNINREIHSNFVLKKSNHQIYLWNNANALIDNINYYQQNTNITYSRFPDGNSKLIYSTPTPNLPNTYAFDSIISPPYFSEHSTKGNIIPKIEIFHDNPKVQIYYTLDGSEPTKESYYYQHQILLDTSVVIRAKAFLNGAISENDISFSYFPNEKSNLSVMSFLIDTNLLFNQDFGIFVEDNIYKDIEIPIVYDFIDGKSSYSSNCGLKLHGQGSLGIIQKSFRLISRNLYKNDVFNYSFWGYNKSTKFQTIVLKNGGNDWSNTMLRDIFINVLAKNYVNDVIFSNQKFVSTYINNSFYGIHILREKIDENLLSEKFNVSKESFNILKDERELVSGDISNYYSTIDTILKSDSINEFYLNFDIKNFSNYLFFRFYSSIIDWPNRNNIAWQSSEIDNKYRFCLYDFDRSLYNEVYSHHTKNMFLHLNEFSSPFAKLFNKIKNYPSFQREMSNTFADNLNLKFSKENTERTLDSLILILEPNISIQTQKYPNSLEFYNEHILRMKLFFSERPHYLFKHIVEEFNQTGTTEITLSQNIKNAGIFHLNNIDIYDSIWTGKYFNEIPINISVKTNPGYQFVGWENSENTDSILTDINILKFNQFNAIFVQVGEPINSKSNILVINEIMYKAADNMKCGDWIELYNNSNSNINLTSYTLRDKNNENAFKIPENIILAPYDYIIIAQDILKFRSYYGVAKNVIGDFDFGFGEDDAVRLFDYNNNLIDEVHYSNKDPWDSGADNTGKSLELLHPNYDNSLAWNWKAAETHSGTPLEVNSQFITKVELNKEQISVYPNPVEGFLTINLLNNSNSKIVIYDIFGKEVLSLKTNQSVVKIDFSEYLSGFYVINIYNSDDELISTSKIIKK